MKSENSKWFPFTRPKFGLVQRFQFLSQHLASCRHSHSLCSLSADGVCHLCILGDFQKDSAENLQKRLN